MKIVSDFSDYYDHSEYDNSTDTPSIIYFRRTRKCDFVTHCNLTLAYNFECKYFSDRILNPTWSVSFFTVGFCGFLVKGVKLENLQNKQCVVSYTPSGVDYLARKIGLLLPSTIVEESCNYLKDYRVNDDHTFSIVGAPIYLVEPNTVGYYDVTINPNLNDLMFYKVFNTKEAFHRVKSFIEYKLACTKIDNSSSNDGRVLHDLINSGWGTKALFELPHGY